MRGKSLYAVATAAVLACTAGHAMAGSSVSNLSVMVDVVTGCSIEYSNSIFTSFDHGAGIEVAGTAQTQLRCASGTAYAISYDQGENPDASSSCLSPQRRAAEFSGVSYLNYEIYQDAGYSQAVGCDPSNEINGVSAGGYSSHDLYWRIPADQPGVTQGGYHSDNVIVTVTF